MEYGIRINQNYLGIPIQAECPEELLEVFEGGFVESEGVC